MPKFAGSILPCAQFIFFLAVYHGKIPVVLKTAGAKQVFTPLSYGKYFPVVDRCRLASSCVCTGISHSVLLQCRLRALVTTEEINHKVRTYKEYHSVCPSSELGLSQPLSRQRAVLPGRGKPSRPAFPKSKAALGPFKAGTVFNQSINQNK